ASALEKIGDPATIPALAHALLHDPHPLVRQNAEAALRSFGSDSAGALVRLLRESKEWPLDGMKALIATLGALKHRSAGPALAWILFDDLPRIPIRWTNQPALRAAYLSLALLGVFLLEPVRSAPDSMPSL